MLKAGPRLAPATPLREVGKSPPEDRPRTWERGLAGVAPSLWAGHAHVRHPLKRHTRGRPRDLGIGADVPRPGIWGTLGCAGLMERVSKGVRRQVGGSTLRQVSVPPRPEGLRAGRVPSKLVWPPPPEISLCPALPLAVLLGSLVPQRPSLFYVSLAKKFTVLFGSHTPGLESWFRPLPMASP